MKFEPMDNMDDALDMLLWYCQDDKVTPEHFVKLQSAYKTGLDMFNQVLRELEQIYNPPCE